MAPVDCGTTRCRWRTWRIEPRQWDCPQSQGQHCERGTWTKTDDKARPHPACLVLEYLDIDDTTLIYRPAYAPDPIELMGNALDCQMPNQKLQEFKNGEHWCGIPQDLPNCLGNSI